MKITQLVTAAGGAGSMFFAASSAHAVITGISVVPVSFEQGWLDETGAPISTGTSPTSISQDALVHARVAAAWVASHLQYRTVRLYLETSNVGDGVNGVSGHDIAPHQINLLLQTIREDGSPSDKGFFNYSSGAAAQSNAGPQPFSATSTAQGQRAYDSYLTVGTTEQAMGFGAPIEGDPTFFDAVRGSSVTTPSTIGTGETGGLNGANFINCQNCGYLNNTPIASQAYSYDTGASLAYNGGVPIVGQGVLVGQFTFNRTDCLIGQMLAVGVGTNVSAAWEFSIGFNPSGKPCYPSPGAIGLLGIAAAAPRRRRR